MFATLLMEEARTQARRNAGVAGIMAVIAAGFMLLSLLELPVLSSTLLVGAFVALVAMPAVVSIQIGIAVLTSAAVATLLVAGWFASFAHLLGVTLEQFFEPVRQMISLVGIGMLVFYGLTVVEGVVVMIIEVAAVMSIGAQGRWNRLGFGAPAVGLVIVYVVNQITALVATLLLPLSLDIPSGRVVGRMMLPQFIEAVRADQEPHLVGIGSVVVAPILAAILV